MGGFTFGFEVNESLLAMSSEKDKSDTNSDTLNNGDNNISDSVVNSSVHNKGLVFNQTFEDNEMMKKLLLCSETSAEDLAHDNGDIEDHDGQDVVVESPTVKGSLKTRDVDNLNIKNFNYDVIVHFVRQAW